MTVAAVLIVDAPEAAVADASGRTAVGRVVDTAWAGGALPIVVVGPDPDGTIAASLHGGRATQVDPAPGATSGAPGATSGAAAPQTSATTDTPARDTRAPGPSVTWLTKGRDTAATLVASTGAVLAWPIRFPWVGAETVTTLIEAHGIEPDAIIRPRWQGAPGWPVLLPVAALDASPSARPERGLEDLVADLEASGVPVRTLDLGDPGTLLDRDTPLDALPPYTGPRGPLRPPPEWGASLEDDPSGRPDPSGGGPGR